MIQQYCPCGGIILADTEDWDIPLCYECYLEIGEPKEERKKTTRKTLE